MKPAYVLGAGQNKKNSFISEKPGLQLVKNPLTMQETLVWFLGQEGPLEKEQATHSSILGLT